MKSSGASAGSCPIVGVANASFDKVEGELCCGALTLNQTKLRGHRASIGKIKARDGPPGAFGHQSGWIQPGGGSISFLCWRFKQAQRLRLVLLAAITDGLVLLACLIAGGPLSCGQFLLDCRKIGMQPDLGGNEVGDLWHEFNIEFGCVAADRKRRGQCLVFTFLK
jgi:hypothetical protein